MPTTAASPLSKPTTQLKAKTASDGFLARHRHWFFTLALLPLAFSVLLGGNDTADRFARTLANHRETLEHLGDHEISSLGSLLDLLPGHAIEGALLSHDTFMHWLFALVAAGLFVGLIVSLFELGDATLLHILLAGLFTATVGIFSLLMFQFAASWTQGYIITGRNWLVLIFWVVKMIGFSYEAALNPENGFVFSFIGFTLGVGLCEEITKLLPLAFCRDSLSKIGWQGTLVWGLASGAGFGIAEGVMYASRHYNGLAGADIYLVRFVSCVALHAVWTGTCALIFYDNQDVFEDLEDWSDLLVGLIKIVLVPMILHGLYDTLLKRDMDIAALVVALASFIPLAWLMARAEANDEGPSARARRRLAARTA